MTEILLERLKFLLETVSREEQHLTQTTGRLFTKSIDAAWVESLEDSPEIAERLDAFVARFGRMQDTIGDKLIPEMLKQVLETPGSLLDNLNRMEKLGLISSVQDWIEARNIRNRLVHEYMRDAKEFAQALNRAHELVSLLIETNRSIRNYVRKHIKLE